MKKKFKRERNLHSHPTLGLIFENRKLKKMLRLDRRQIWRIMMQREYFMTHEIYKPAKQSHPNDVRS